MNEEELIKNNNYTKIKEFIINVSLLLTDISEDELLKSINEIYCLDFQDCHKLLQKIIETNGINLEKYLESNFYKGIINSLVSMININSCDNIENNFWVETKISSLLLEIMGKKESFTQIIMYPKDFIDKLENIPYRNNNLLNYFNDRMSKLKNNDITSMDMLVNNKNAMDLIEAISDCSYLLEINNREDKEVKYCK